MKWPDGVPPGGEAAVLSAIADVAERSFYATIAPGDEEWWAGRAGLSARWLSAAVRFEEPDGNGTVSCWLTAALADRLLDAFSGRDPEGPAVDPRDVDDLAGEFGNMICGAWLTRVANDRTFVLHPPVVTRQPPTSGARRSGLKISLEGQPCLVEISFDRADPV